MPQIGAHRSQNYKKSRKYTLNVVFFFYLYFNFFVPLHFIQYFVVTLQSEVCNLFGLRIKFKNMMKVNVDDKLLRAAAENNDLDSFVQVFIDAINTAIGGQLTAENMAELNSDQITLLAWSYLHEEMMDGGMIQLIHNGYGAFIWLNPTDKAFREWSESSDDCKCLHDLFKLINKSHKLWNLHHEEIEQDMSDEDFMALYEKYPEFDEFDDLFVSNEEEWTEAIARYIDEHIENFGNIIENNE